ncbi:hypothetical protein G6F40_015960 [Rhizopus arrhizus]|nr:hypothetical protein G6F40_015960 [Rhizopus arrhizus]
MAGSSAPLRKGGAKKAGGRARGQATARRRRLPVRMAPGPRSPRAGTGMDSPHANSFPVRTNASPPPRTGCAVAGGAVAGVAVPWRVAG